MSEAGRWLTKNKNESPFASNYFFSQYDDGRQAAIDLVEELYEAGAKRVEVGEIYDEPERIKREGGPYAATLFICIEGCTKAQRARVRRVARSYEPDEMDDWGVGVIRIWWD